MIRHASRALRLAVATAVATAGSTLVSSPAVAADGESIAIRLAEAPAARADDPRAQAYIVDHVSPGTRFTRDVEVTNHTTEPRVIDVLPGPAEIVANQWTVAAPGATSDLTRWTTLGQDRLRLDPGASATVPVTVGVPADATEGERYGVVWASTASDADGAVRQVSRVGIRIYLSVGPGGEPATDFDITDLAGRRTPGGALRLVASVDNTGGRAVDLAGTLALRDGPGGLRAGPFEATSRTTLAPGASGTVAIDLDPELPLGPWRARLSLASGEVTDSMTGTVTFPERAGDSDATELGAGVPWWAAAVGVLLLALGLLWRLLARRRERHRDRT